MGKITRVNKLSEIETNPMTLKTATIASGAALSDAVSLADLTAAGLIMPAAWTAADLTFQGSADGVTYNNIYDVVGAELTVKAAQARYIPLNMSNLFGVQYLKIRSGTSGTAVNQAADRAIVLVCFGL